MVTRALVYGMSIRLGKVLAETLFKTVASLQYTNIIINIKAQEIYLNILQPLKFNTINKFLNDRQSPSMSRSQVRNVSLPIVYRIVCFGHSC